MPRALLADTHATVWYLARSKRLSVNALQAMDDATVSGERVYVSAITLVEIIYLIERGRLPQAALERLMEKLRDPASPLTLAPLDMAAALTVEQVPRDQVPEMPDRIIAATATALGVPLVTADSELRAAAIETIW